MTEFYEFQQRLFGFFQKFLLVKQILAAVTRDAQFGKNDNLDALSFCLRHHVFYGHGIGSAVGQSDYGHGGGNFYESVIHILCDMLILFMGCSKN